MMRHAVRCFLQAGLLAALLAAGAAGAARAQAPIEKTYCTTAVGYQSVESMKIDLLNNAKRLAVNEFFGEFISASTAVENAVVTGDQIRASGVGFIRVSGDAEYYNGSRFAEVCVRIHAFVTQQDLKMTEPVHVSKRVCLARENMTDEKLADLVKTEAVVQALQDYDRRLTAKPADQVQRLLHKISFAESGFLPDATTYCAAAAGDVTPIEVLAYLSADTAAAPAKAASSQAALTVSVTAPEQGFQVLHRSGGSIDAAETWKSGSIYVLEQDLTVSQNGQLTIEPGVIVKVARGTGIYVQGSLRIAGTAANGVIFTSLADDEAGGDIDENQAGVLPAPGDWQGIFFADSSRDDKSALSFVAIRYAGSPIHLNNAAPLLTNLQLTQNGANGYFLDAGTWRSTGLNNVGNPYIVNGDITIDDKSMLTIGPDVVLKFADAGLYVNGALNAKVTPEHPITFTSLGDDEVAGDTDNNGDAVLPGPGNWQGILFSDSSRDDKSVMENVRIRYARTPIRLSNAAPRLSGLLLEHNVGNGYWLDAGSWRTTTWNSVGNPYLLTGDITVDDKSTLKIEPGVVVKAAGAGLYIQGVLNAAGTTANPIVFTALADDEWGGDADNNADAVLPGPGSWQGIQFADSSRDDKNVLQNVVIRYAEHPIRLSNAAPALSDLRLEQNTINGYWLEGGTWKTSHWSSVGNAYVAGGDITVDEMSSLTIDPGVVVKFPSGGLYVRGALIGEGTGDNPIIFTALADDTVGGDTDNNQDAVLPAPGSWAGVYFYNTPNANKSKLSNAVLRYAEKGYVLADGAMPTVSQVELYP